MKVKKLLGVLLALAMVLSICTVTAFAADEPPAGVIAAADFGTQGINKTLKVADGITGYPNTFTFSFTAQDCDPTTTAAEAPAIPNQTVTVGTQTGGKATGMTSFQAILDSITGDGFPHAGEYVYQVVETTQASLVTENGITKTLTVDPAVYTVHFFVTNGTNGPEVTNIVVKDGTTKANLDFENTYTEVITNPLEIVKTITGTYADMTMTFPVTVTLTIPATATAADVEVEGAATVAGVTPPTVNVDDSGALTIVVTATLGHGQSIKFTKLPAGTTFVVEEDQDANYRAKVTGFVNPVDQDYAAEGVDVNKNGAGPIVVAGNNVSIENHRDELVPTGVVIENLPYVLLFVIAAAGVVYLCLKKKARA